VLYISTDFHDIDQSSIPLLLNSFSCLSTSRCSLSEPIVSNSCPHSSHLIGSADQIISAASIMIIGSSCSTYFRTISFAFLESDSMFVPFASFINFYTSSILVNGLGMSEERILQLNNILENNGYITSS
jgi:hypothetical protein